MTLQNRIEELEHRLRDKFPEAVFRRGNDWLHVILRTEKVSEYPVVEVGHGIMNLEVMESLLANDEYVCYAQTSSNLQVMNYSMSIKFRNEPQSESGE